MSQREQILADLLFLASRVQNNEHLLPVVLPVSPVTSPTPTERTELENLRRHVAAIGDILDWFEEGVTP